MGRLPGGVDRPARDSGAARLGAPPGQAGRAALQPQVPGPRRAGRRRGVGADERSVRRGRAATAAPRTRLPVESRSRVDSRCGSSPRWTSRSTCSPSWSPAGCAPTPATWRSRPSPGSGRCWPRCSSPRSATSPASPDAEQLASWAGLTPKHHESDTTVQRGRITKQGSRLVRWAAVEAVQRVPARTRLGPTPGPGRATPRPQHRRGRRRPRADRRWCSTACVITTSAALRRPAASSRGG